MEKKETDTLVLFFVVVLVNFIIGYTVKGSIQMNMFTIAVTLYWIKYRRLKKKREYIYGKCKEEHPLIYEEAIEIKNEYDMVKKESNGSKIFKNICYVVVAALSFNFIYTSSGSLYNMEVIDIVLYLFFVIMLVITTYIFLNPFKFIYYGALADIESKIYSLCLESTNDEEAVNELKDYRAQVEKKRWLTNKFENMRNSSKNKN